MSRSQPARARVAMAIASTILVAGMALAGKPGTGTPDAGKTDGGEEYPDLVCPDPPDDEQPCTLNGCTGVKYCAGGRWGRCMSCGGTKACTKCGAAGVEGCTESCGGNGVCTVPDRSCNPNSCSNAGLQACQSDGGWSACSGCSGSRVCPNCGTNGTEACLGTCQWSGVCNVPERPCATPQGCSQVGTQACQTNGTWGACTGCGGQAECPTAECNVPSVATCNAACVPGACAPVSEQCNNCDDSPVGSPGHGKVDEGIHCPTCDL